MEKKNIIIIIIIFVAISFGSYLAFQQFLGDEEDSVTTERIELENYANQVKVDNKKFAVLNTKTSASENVVELMIDTTKTKWVIDSYSETETGNQLTNTDEKPASKAGQGSLAVPKEAYETAKQTSDSVIIVKERTTSTKTPPYWMFSISIGVIISAILGAGLLTKQELRGTATSKLLEEGLEKLTVRDVEIFSQIMRMEEFTIPELMRKTETSKVTTWRTVKKLVEEGLVEETDEKKPPSRGLGGRGKPSKVYKFKE